MKRIILLIVFVFIAGVTTFSQEIKPEEQLGLPMLLISITLR